MHMYSAIFGAGTVGPFSSRAFVPAFITALLLRFAPEWTPWFPEDMVGIAEQAPSWFTSNWSLTIFGILAALEIAATKSPDIRAAYQEVDKYAKSIVAFITYMGIASVQDVGFVENATKMAGVGRRPAGTIDRRGCVLARYTQAKRTIHHHRC